MNTATFITALTLAGATLCALGLPEGALDPPPIPMKDKDRVLEARQTAGPVLKERFRKAGLPYPPREVFLRAFKQEGELEVWVRGKEKAFTKIATYPITASSGVPGPKRFEGDGQVPEGFYQIEIFNPQSNFYLSLGLNYPNAADRALGDPKEPGSDIYIHGGNLSIGCLPLGDEAIAELYLLAMDTRAHGQSPLQVHLFPARMSGPAWERLRREEIAKRPDLQAFWDSLQPIYDAFEKTRTPPKVAIDKQGGYSLVR